MVLAPLWFQMQALEALSLAPLKEAVGMDQKMQRAAPDDRWRPQKGLPLSNPAWASGL